MNSRHVFQVNFWAIFIIFLNRPFWSFLVKNHSFSQKFCNFWSILAIFDQVWIFLTNLVIFGSIRSFLPKIAILADFGHFDQLCDFYKIWSFLTNLVICSSSVIFDFDERFRKEHSFFSKMTLFSKISTFRFEWIGNILEVAFWNVKGESGIHFFGFMIHF